MTSSSTDPPATAWLARPSGPKRPGISSRDPRVANVAMVDGQVYSASEGTPPNALRALITIAGGEKVDVYEAVHAK
jgi:hypothetical protein